MDARDAPGEGAFPNPSTSATDLVSSEVQPPLGDSPAPTPETGPSLGAKAVSGSFWTALRFAGEYGLRLGSNLILTRILVPEAFGLMVFVSVLMTGLAMFSDVGITSVVVQSKRGDDPVFLDTVWTIQVLRGAVLTAIAALLAVPMAHFYGEPQLVPLIRVASLTTLIGGFNSISLVKLQRHLRIKKLAAIELSAQVFNAAVKIAWALVVPSVWALVFGGLVGSLGKMVLSHTVAREHRCRFAWESDSVGQVLQFGKWIFLSTVLFFMAGQSDKLIFGYLFTTAQLGVFGVAGQYAMIPTQVIWRIGNAVVFPALSRRRESEGGLVPVYRRAQMPLLVVGAVPVMLLMATGPELIEVLYDPRYAGAGWMLQILAVTAWIQIPQASSGSVLLALGIPRWIAIANGVKFAGMLVGLPLGYHFFGDPGAIAGLAAAELLRWATLASAIRSLGLPILRADIVVSVLVACVTLVANMETQWLSDAHFGAIARLAAASGTILLLWLPVSFVLLRKEIPRLRQELADRRARRVTVQA